MKTNDNTTVDEIEFKQWILSIKKHISKSQIQVANSINSELIHLYWFLGKEIITRQAANNWGSGFLQKMSEELMSEFPNFKGLSYRNLRYIKQWYSFYNQDITIWQQVVAKLKDDIFFSIPWGHHLIILSTCSEIQKAIYFLGESYNNGWSRSTLSNFLHTDLYERQGKGINNFNKIMPESQSILADQLLKDPYNFDFIGLKQPYNESNLEESLTNHITQFLIELGKGFAYVGRQVPLQIGQDTIFIDLLFYHIELRCYIVIELKTVKFAPSFVGQLGTYISAVNHLKKKQSDNQTIGLLICKSKNEIMAQYALEAVSQPIGITQYKLEGNISKEIANQLPSVQDITSSLINQ